MKKILLLSIAMLFIAGTAMATPFVLPSNQPIYLQFNNLELVDTSLNNALTIPGFSTYTGTQGNWGFLNVSSIQLGGVVEDHFEISGGPGIFLDDGPGGTQGQITGIFYGIQLTSGTTSTGGILDLYWHDTGSDNITQNDLNGVTLKPDAAGVARITSGTFLTRINFATGAIDGDNVTTISSDTNIQGSFTRGFADSFGSIDMLTTGPWSNPLNTDWFYVDTDGDGIRGEADEKRDIRFSNIFFGLPAWTPGGSQPNILGLKSNDPARGYTVPEPGTISLLGCSLLGFAIYSIRRRRRNK